MPIKSGNDLGDLGDLLGSLFGIPVSSRTQQKDASQDGDGPIPADAEVTDPDSGGSSDDGDKDKDGGSTGGGEVHISFLERFATWSRRALIVLAIVGVIVLAGCYWWFHPAINLHSISVWWWIALICAIAAAALWVASLRHEEHQKILRKLIIIPVAIVAIGLIGKVAGFTIIPGNAERYASVLQTTEGTFAEDIEQVNYSEVPVIDRDSAILLGNRAMGSIPEFVSQFEISPAYSQINYHGHPVRVSPLVYADLFKWLMNRGDGIPAYVIVDMTTQDAQVVRLEQGIKYSDSEPLARNIDRYVQLRYPTYMFDEKAFEIDEDGTPWWVFPVQRRTIGLFDGTTIQRVVLVNACTGETQDYPIEECPQWVDRAYPSDLLITQYNWSGLYSGGWLNSWLGQKQVVRTTPGTDGTLGYNYIAQNDDVYLYSGVSSVTADNSIIGFILVNQRTGESRFFSVAGATEDSAMVSAEGAVQNLRYRATFPILLNIEGEPTYFMALKDGAGLVKKYAMVNIQQYQNVAVGDTVAATQREYLRMLSESGTITQVDVAQSTGLAKVKGTVARISTAVIDGNSHFYVTLDGAEVAQGEDSTLVPQVDESTIFDFALPTMLSIVIYQPGDEIEFYFTEIDGQYKATGFVGETILDASVDDESEAEQGESAEGDAPSEEAPAA